MWNPTAFIAFMLGIAAAVPAIAGVGHNSVSAARNSSQPFHLRMKVIHGDKTYDNWVLQEYHVGAALSVTVFQDPSQNEGTTLFLNNTHLQVPAEGRNYPFSMNAPDMIAGHSRWLSVTFEPGEGSAGFGDHGSSGIVIDSSGFDGWLVCEWSLNFNVPELFQMMRFDDRGPGYGPFDIPSSCARVLLMPQYIEARNGELS